MIVLGFDTSTSATAVALRLADRSTTHARDDPPPGAHPGHATRLLPMAHELLVAAGVPWSAVERIAVGVGPGTFTGLRVGVATARGLAQSLCAELVGVSSLQALAAAALAAESQQAGERVAVLAVIDARRGEVFAAAYTGFGDDPPVALTTPAALVPEELPAIVGRVEGASATQDEPWRWLAVGDGVVRYREPLRTAGIRTLAPTSPLNRVDGAAICQLGVRAAPMSLAALLPDYLRRPDAELALLAAETATDPVT